MACDLCEPAPHPNCETYAVLMVRNPETGRTKVLDVCLEHYEVFKQAGEEDGVGGK